MRIVPPIEIDDTGSPSQFVASNVPEDDETEWDSTTTYSDGDVVMVTDAGVHKRYESLKDSNTDNYPPDTTSDDLSDPWWLELGPTNRWAMFNDTVGEATSSSETFSESTYAADTVDGTAAGIAVQITPQQAVNYIAAFNIEGVYADLIIKNSDGNTTYSERKSLITTIRSADWYSYFFDETVHIGDATSFPGLPTVSEGDIYFSVQKKPDGPAEVGVLAMGTMKNLGVSTYGTSVGIIDFSRKERDTFGNFQIVERGFAKELDAEVSIPFDRVSFVQSELAKRRAKPTIYEASDSVNATLIYGFFRDFDITISTPSITDATITIEGLV
jgi:hypothetical protein